MWDTYGDFLLPEKYILFERFKTNSSVKIPRRKSKNFFSCELDKEKKSKFFIFLKNKKNKFRITVNIIVTAFSTCRINTP